MRKLRTQKGSILILSLWTLMFLTVFAVQIGMRVRQRVNLLSRIEHRSELHYIASSGIKKAMAALRYDMNRHATIYTSLGKAYRHNNVSLFKEIPLGSGVFNVKHYLLAGDQNPVKLTRYGFTDEERKLNINISDRYALARLIRFVAVSDEDKALELADAIIEWRELGDTELVGFRSDEYYANLEYPYEPKNEAFEILDELMLVRGFTPTIYKRLKPFVTIYTDGMVNVNTASREVLIALGLSESMANKVLSVRRGVDQEESTQDDYIFYKTFDIASEIQSFIELENSEIHEIDSINKAGKIKTNSSYFMIESEASLNSSDETLTVACVYNMSKNKIEYWREK